MEISLLFRICIGIILATMTGLGLGGGSLFMLWLTAIVGMGYSEARLLNLLFFIPSALISIGYCLLKRQIRFKDSVPAIIAGCSSAVCFSNLSTNWNIDHLQTSFGILLIVIAIREICYSKKEKRP